MTIQKQYSPSKRKVIIGFICAAIFLTSVFLGILGFSTYQYAVWSHLSNEFHMAAGCTSAPNPSLKVPACHDESLIVVSMRRQGTLLLQSPKDESRQWTVVVGGQLSGLVSEGDTVTATFWRGKVRSVRASGIEARADDHPDVNAHKIRFLVISSLVGALLIPLVFISEYHKVLRRFEPEIPWMPSTITAIRFGDWDITEARDELVLTARRSAYLHKAFVLLAMLTLAVFMPSFFSGHLMLPTMSTPTGRADAIRLAIFVLAFTILFWLQRDAFRVLFFGGELRFCRDKNVILRDGKHFGEISNIKNVSLKPSSADRPPRYSLSVVMQDGSSLFLHRGYPFDIVSLRPFGAHLAKFLGAEFVVAE